MGIRSTTATLVCMALVATGCGSDEGAGDDPTEVSTASPEDTPTVSDTETADAGGGTLTVAISSDPGSLNPAITTSGAVHTASETFFNGLVALDADGAPVPELAESWEIADDGREYTFTLRDDVTWHDGEPFTADDVVFTFEEALLQLHARTQASMGSALESIEATDDHTVVFRFTEPYAPLLQQLNVTEAPILPEHVYGDGTPLEEHPANTAPVGTGPFVFESYTEGSEIRATANPDYFKDGPFLDGLVMRVIPDEGTQLLSLESGEVDFLWGVPGPDLARLEEDPAFVLESTPSNPGGANCIMTISFNLERPITSDLAVRQAIGHALDRDRFVDQVLFGQGQVAEAPISSGIPWAHAPDVELPTYDVDEARRLLDEAGWVEGDGGVRSKDGETLTIDFVHFPTFSKYGELVREQLGEVGFDVELVALEPPVFGPTVFAEDDFDTNVISYCNGPDPEIGVRRMYDSALIGDVPFTNAAQYSDPDVDRLFEEASQTVATEDRSPIYAEIQRIVAEDLPYMWLVETVGTRAWSARCEGFQPHTGLFAESARCSDA
ncbi:MAG: ABC transporter substrate-binding protein [Actinobacteria bacterium]|nr:ABC transporter substrate-binding protein [Actinomycetota bacterium]